MTSATYSTQEVADLLGLPYETARKRIQRAGLVPHHSYGNSKFYTARQIDQLRTKTA